MMPKQVLAGVARCPQSLMWRHGQVNKHNKDHNPFVVSNLRLGPSCPA